MRKANAGHGIHHAFLVAALISSASVAQDAAVGDSGVHALSIEQLCAQRNSPENWAEIERRGVFTDRDLRAIRKENIRNGINVAAVSCLLGPPEEIQYAGSEPTTSYPSVFEIYFYPNGDRTTVVAVEHVADHSTVVDWHETEGLPTYELFGWDASVRLSCGSSGCNFPEDGASSPQDDFTFGIFSGVGFPGGPQ